MKRKNKKTNFIIVLLFTAFFLCSCTKQTNVSAEGTSEAAMDTIITGIEETVDADDTMTVSLDTLALSMLDKYDEEYSYGEAYEALPRDASIEIPLGFSLSESEFTQYTQIVELFTDDTFSTPASNGFDYVEDEKLLKITPPKYPNLTISSSFAEDYPALNGYDKGEYTFFQKEQQKDWGNYGKYYLLQKVDYQTGEKLEKPIVHVVTMEGEIKEAPKVCFSQTEDGTALLEWDPIKDAKLYAIVQVNIDKECGYFGNALLIGVTDQCSFSKGEDYDSLQNSDFRIFDLSESDWYDEYMYEAFKDEATPYEPTYSEATLEEAVGVIAINDTGTSMISNLIQKTDVASLLPYARAFDTEEGEEISYVDSIELAPSYRSIILCDGWTTAKLIKYDFEQKEYFNQIQADENAKTGELTNVVFIPAIRLPYTIEGTNLTGDLYINHYNPETIDAEFDELKERQEGLERNSGLTTPKLTLAQAEHTQQNLSSNITVNKGITITGNSALSEYLAANMLAGNEKIDLSAFPESQDSDYLTDAWLEAVYQNPLVLTVNGGKRVEKSLVLDYGENSKEKLVKQSEIIRAVKAANDSILSKDMSELQKVLAINEYLCENVDYDKDALNNAKKYDYTKVDKEFQDAFTPYGALINHKSVCSGYAGAFQMMAQSAGLEAIVVTGNLDGNITHAWNKVKIDDEWVVVDVTNNDNEQLYNALLNLSDSTAQRTLVENKEFVMDKCLNNYEAPSEDNEFYRISHLYYDESQIAKELYQGLKENGHITLRTNSLLNDDDFYGIAKEVMRLGGTDYQNLSGYYWLGVIYLEK